LQCKLTVCASLDAGCVALLVLLILTALMLYRWRTHNDPLPQRMRTVYNRTFHSTRNAENDLYAMNNNRRNVRNKKFMLGFYYAQFTGAKLLSTMCIYFVYISYCHCYSVIFVGLISAFGNKRINSALLCTLFYTVFQKRDHPYGFHHN